MDAQYIEQEPQEQDVEQEPQEKQDVEQEPQELLTSMSDRFIQFQVIDKRGSAAVHTTRAESVDCIVMEGNKARSTFWIAIKGKGYRERICESDSTDAVIAVYQYLTGFLAGDKASSDITIVSVDALLKTATDSVAQIAENKEQKDGTQKPN